MDIRNRIQTFRINNPGQICMCGFGRRAQLQPSAPLLDGGHRGRRGALYEVLVLRKCRWRSRT